MLLEHLFMYMIINIINVKSLFYLKCILLILFLYKYIEIIKQMLKYFLSNTVKIFTISSKC